MSVIISPTHDFVCGVLLSFSAVHRQPLLLSTSGVHTADSHTRFRLSLILITFLRTLITSGALPVDLC